MLCAPSPPAWRGASEMTSGPGPLPSGGPGATQPIFEGERSAAPPLSAPWIPRQRLRGGVPSAAGRAATAFPAGSVPRPWEGARKQILVQVLPPPAGPCPRAPTPSPPPGAGATVYLQPPAADQARVVHGGGSAFGPGKGGGRRRRRRRREPRARARPGPSGEERGGSGGGGCAGRGWRARRLRESSGIRPGGPPPPVAAPRPAARHRRLPGGVNIG